MPRLKGSSGSPPEFFADRCLGRGAPSILVQRGWRVHIVSDVFPDDGQNVSDPEWIEYGLAHGWGLPTQDVRIATQPAVLALLRRYEGCVHCLDSAELPVHVKADRFDSRRGAIFQHIRDRRVGFFMIHEHGAPRRRRM